jgi:hypothetical protein
MRAATIRVALAWGVLLGATTGPVGAQLPQFSPAVNPTQRPIISPWLNLTRGGNQGVNYYGLVRPQFNFQNADRQLGQEVNVAQQTANQALTQPGVIDLNLPATGHRAGFQTQRRYFMTLGQGGATGGAQRGGVGIQGVGRPGMAVATGGLGVGGAGAQVAPGPQAPRGR